MFTPDLVYSISMELEFSLEQCAAKNERKVE
jgi:hypothetical protein